MSAWLALAALAAEPEDAESLFQRARQAEGSGEYELAVSSCQRLVEELPQSARAPACRRRLSFLSARQDLDGAFAGWGALQEVRASVREGDRQQLGQRVEQVWASPAASPTTRAEAAGWLAREALARGDAIAALRYSEGWQEAPGELSSSLGQVRAVALAELGRDVEAQELQALVSVPAAPEGARPTPVQQVLTRQRQGQLASASGATLVLFGLLALPAAARALWAERVLPLGLLPIGLAAAGTFALAELWEAGAGRAAPWMGLGFGGVHLLSVGALRAAQGRALATAAVRLGALLATAAVAWLALWATETLDWVGAG